jgi:hypothetical protein
MFSLGYKKAGFIGLLLGITPSWNWGYIKGIFWSLVIDDKGSVVLVVVMSLSERRTIRWFITKGLKS